MTPYVIARVDGAPDWTQIAALPIDQAAWLPAAGVTASAQLCYDAEALHVRLCARERDVRAEETGPLGQPWRDSCLELFFCPQEGDDRYFNVEFNPAGCLFLGFGRGRADRIRLIADTFPLDPVIRREEGGWEIAYRIPAALIRVFFPGWTPAPGLRLRANCYKCGETTDPPHYLTWRPRTCAAPDFHRSCDFGDMVLGGKSPQSENAPGRSAAP